LRSEQTFPSLCCFVAGKTVASWVSLQFGPELPPDSKDSGVLPKKGLFLQLGLHGATSN
jgi:hypothetical protein